MYPHSFDSLELCTTDRGIKNSCVIHYILVSCEVQIIFLVQAAPSDC